MLLSDAQLYQETGALKLGLRSLSGSFQQLGRWVSEKYGVHVLNIRYTTPKMEPSLRRARLTVIVDTAVELVRMRKNVITLMDGVEEDIIAALGKFASSTGDHYPDLDRAFVIVEAFEELAVIKMLWSVDQKHQQEIRMAFPDANLWCVSAGMGTLIVFYRTDDDVRKNESSECSAGIRDLCFALAQKYDEFAFLRLETFPISFDSKENLDKNYAGNLYNYHH